MYCIQFKFTGHYLVSNNDQEIHYSHRIEDAMLFDTYNEAVIHLTKSPELQQTNYLQDYNIILFDTKTVITILKDYNPPENLENLKDNSIITTMKNHNKEIK